MRDGVPGADPAVLETGLVVGQSYLESLKLYVGFGEASSATLRAIYPVVAPHVPAIIEDFYATIEAHPGAAGAITGGRAQIERLKQTLRRWLEELFVGPHDDSYVARRARIGRVHVRISLPQAYMFTAMNRIRVRTAAVIHEALAADPAALAQTTTALHQIMDIELAIMLETYREDLMAKVEQERLRSEHERSERQQQELIEAVPAFVIALDAEGRIVFWNRQLEQATGYGREEMLGQPGSGLIGSGGVRPLPVKGGRDLLVRWKRASSAQPPGSASRTYAVGTDVTGEEEMLRRALRAERLAAVGTLAAGLAHEVRNPLNSAALQLQVLRRRLRRDDLDKASAEPILAIVDDEIRRLERLVQDFLAFVHPRPLTLRPTALAELCQGVLASVAPELEKAGVKASFEADPGLPDLHLDPERLRQVLENLVRNAIEAMPNGGRLGVRARRAPGGDAIEIDVADTGHGFGDEAPIFDAFFTTKPKGTGLGLAIVHRIVSDHGGTVRVRSRQGDTCFTVSLPTTPAG